MHAAHIGAHTLAHAHTHPPKEISFASFWRFNLHCLPFLFMVDSIIFHSELNFKGFFYPENPFHPFVEASLQVGFVFARHSSCTSTGNFLQGGGKSWKELICRFWNPNTSPSAINSKLMKCRLRIFKFHQLNNFHFHPERGQLLVSWVFSICPSLPFSWVDVSRGQPPFAVYSVPAQTLGHSTPLPLPLQFQASSHKDQRLAHT